MIAVLVSDSGLDVERVRLLSVSFSDILIEETKSMTALVIRFFPSSFFPKPNCSF